MATVTDTIKQEVTEEVYNFFSEECEVPRDSLNSSTNILKDLEGDSLMFLELLEIFKKKYNLNVELKSVGKYVVKHPAETISQIIDMTLLIIEHENNISQL